MRKRKRKKQRKIIILSVVSLLCIMTSGYAAFQTNLNVSAKGNVVDKGITPIELKNTYCNQTSGDGLYKDTYEDGRCIYRGTNPNNYITFNNELWRIISIESDNTIKITRKDEVRNQIYDKSGERYQSSGYCNNQNYGCKVWGSNKTMLNSSGNNITTMPREINATAYTLPSKEASINIYLNTEYYNNLSQLAKNQIEVHIFNVGPIKDETNQTLLVDIQQEKNYKWRGKIGLISSTDYIQASTNSNCKSLYSSKAEPYPCKDNNFLENNNSWWTMTPISSNNNTMHVWFKDGAYKRLWFGDCSRGLNVHPTLFIKSNIYIKGEGTETNPYIITE